MPAGTANEDGSVARLIYLSEAVAKFDPDSLAVLAEAAAQSNRSLNVTGWLTYRAGQFVQQLEGDEERISNLYQRIEGDDRHQVLRSHWLPHGERRFDSWSMVLMDPHWLVEWSLDDLLNDVVRDLRAPALTGNQTPATVTQLDQQVAVAHDALTADR